MAGYRREGFAAAEYRREGFAVAEYRREGYGIGKVFGNGSCGVGRRN